MTSEERAEVREWVTASRRAQGLPDRISDPAVLARARDVLRPQGTSRVTASLPALKAKAEPGPEAMLLSPTAGTQSAASRSRVPSGNGGTRYDE